MPTAGVDADDSGVLQQDFCLARTQGDGHVRLQPRESLRFSPVGSTQTLWQPAPRPPLGQCLSPHTPKNASWLQGTWSQRCRSCGERAGRTPRLQTLSSQDFARCGDVASRWKVSKSRRRPSLAWKSLGFRVVTSPCDLRDLHQRDPCRSHLGSPEMFGCFPSWALPVGGTRAESLLSTSDSSEDESSAPKLLLAGAGVQQPCREQSI